MTIEGVDNKFVANLLQSKVGNASILLKLAISTREIATFRYVCHKSYVEYFDSNTMWAFISVNTSEIWYILP